ncbi:MAG: hypothetical protein JO352_03650 [Chloroflexi bacterium]|nr:hypothetical protein [Solirubrobacterales bacterium]MBV9322868.1 hypothetical protein [Chloroflexota bacterium]MBV9602682.1 hypothetical protein [Chloroflexota bacterium]
MPEPLEVEQPYQVPSHLETQQSFGPFPARFILPLMCTGMFPGVPLGVTAYHATGGLLPPAVAAAMLPALVVSPIAAWWLDPPFEHGLASAAAFVKRAYVRPQPPKRVPSIVVYRMPTLNLETASAPLRRQARAQWGAILNGLTHPVKIIVRARPLTTLPVVEQLREHPQLVARRLGEWLESQMVQAGLIERDRLLVIPADDDAELEFRAEAIEKVLRQARLQAERIEPDALPLLRTLTWDPKATQPREAPEVMEEGTAELVADGWWTRAYSLGQFPSAILTNWCSSLLAGDEAVDVAIDVVPKDAGDVKTWVLQPKINQLSTSAPSRKRLIALEQLNALYDAIERRRVAPFEVAVTVLVRGNSRQDLRNRGKKIERRVKSMGGKLHLLRWEQAAGLHQLDPSTTKPMSRRTHLIETGTLARTYPWSDSYLQLENGVIWGEAGQRPCLFTPYSKTNKGPHMCWYGATNAGKSTGAHMLWSRLHLIQNIRIFGIDQDEQHEHCGRFLEYLGGRKLTPRDALDTAEIELHRDDGVVILDLSEVAEDLVGAIFAAWARVVKRHMLVYPGRSIVFVDEAVTVSEDPAGDRALRDVFQRSRHWGQSSHVLTQRPSSWFDTRVGRAIQGNSDAWWCGAQLPRELAEVAEALELSDEERSYVRNAGIGQGLLVSGQRRVALDLFDKLSAEEYAAFHSDPVLVAADPIPFRREASA